MRIPKNWVYLPVLLINDLIVVSLTFWLAYHIRFDFAPLLTLFPVTKGTPPWHIYGDTLRAIVPLWIVVFAIWGRLYHLRFPDAANEFMSVLKGVSLATLMVIAGTFLYRSYDYSRLVIFIAFGLSVVLLFLTRELIKVVVGRVLASFVTLESVAMIGEGKSIKAIADRLAKDPHKKVTTYSGKEIAKVQALIGTKDEPQEVYVSGLVLREEDDALQDLFDLCEDRGIEIKALPYLLEMRLGEITVDDSTGLPVLHLKPLSLHGFRYLVKRVFDVSLCILILTVLAFPFLLIALLIVLDSRGGVFFRQQRVGFREKYFQCLKFRTMHADAEKRLAEMNLQSFRGGPAFKMKGDPRITRVGKWLRKFSFDEFPQIWNVLKGEMSLIGPRPQVMAEANGNPEWAKRRYRILPGITGLWQVSGRADLSYEDMMKLDIYYLENWSPGMDLRILLKTIPVVAFSKGAY
jgi:exopolysaccharide biosynthesis polyprenyl glycosylphosphotransferase